MIKKIEKENEQKLTNQWKNEKWKNYELQNEGICVFQKYHDTDRQWKNIVYTKDAFQKIFWKMEDFSRYFGWNFEISEKLQLTQIIFMYVQKNYSNCTHAKNYKKYIPQKMY